MAQLFGLFSITILLLSLANAVNAVTVHEFDSMINALRTSGYNLFSNAIITSDINYEVLSGTAFTIFAPTDSSLFSLDMTASATEYITALHYHVVPNRFSLSELETFASGASLRSLDPSHDIVLQRRRSLSDEVITVDGVAITVPDLYYGRAIVVHGLGGIISLRSQIGSGEEQPANMTDNNSHETFGFPPEVNHHVAPPPEVMAHFGGFEPSSSDGIDYRLIGSPSPETGSVDGISPVNSPRSVPPAFLNSPESANSSPDIPPAYASSSNSPIYPYSGNGAAAGPFSVSNGQRRHHSDDSGDSKATRWHSYYPWTYRRRGFDEQGEGGSSEVSGNIQAIMPEGEHYAPSVPAPEYYWQFEEKNVDCPSTEDQVADTIECT